MQSEAQPLLRAALLKLWSALHAIADQAACFRPLLHLSENLKSHGNDAAGLSSHHTGISGCAGSEALKAASHRNDAVRLDIILKACLVVQEVKRSNHLQRKIKQRGTDRSIEQAIDDQFATGRLYACLSSRPGQCGRADGFIIEGKELEFYVRRMQRKKGKGGS